MNRDIKKIVAQMTLEEKAGLCSGLDFWHTRGIERLGIPSIMMTDGPHGLRKQEGQADHLGINKSVPATCFPTASCLACSWDEELAEKVGVALGEECQAEGVAVLLGPGVNIKRSPLCGRNFEYFSEDPYLSAKMAAAHIKGVQSQGVGTSLKHFAVNNQEHRRMTVNADLDERALREIYLAGFEMAVREAQPWTVMSAYNKVNGEYCSENKRLLTDILREEWGFGGLVVSDWGAVNDIVAGIQAGLNLEMPSSNGLAEKRIVEAVQGGTLKESKLDESVEALLGIIFKAVDNQRKNTGYHLREHHELASCVARESMVLLKNQDHILPLAKQARIAVLGAFAKEARYQGSGSSRIEPTKLECIYDEIRQAAGLHANISYAAGYRLDSDAVDKALLQKARDTAQKADIAVVFVGLTGKLEAEGFDRTHLRIAENHQALIEEVARVNPNVVVVLSNGAPIEMPWLDRAKGVLECYLGGQALGGAIADILFGAVSPCGKLAETFPRKLEHNPSYLNFPGEGDLVEYREGIFVGYRYYDSKKIEPLFPFGYGLSYTEFEYRDITLDKDCILDTETVTVCVKVKNTGQVAGKEIVQLYVKDVAASVVRPEKELKGFQKIFLLPGEEKTVTFTLDKRAFAYYNPVLKDWHVETGEFIIMVGKSSRDILLNTLLTVESTVTVPKKLTRFSTLGELLHNSAGAEVANTMLAASAQPGTAEDQAHFVREMMKGMPLYKFVQLSRGVFTFEMLDAILASVNDRSE
ncbi:Thermostable beta-glucosidase B [Propionispora sp. 2/2-37]|uniref:glycoside hydrolase family 3 C-terminal domain-containing protein n=1 Tax=Propionispora sp. 2/2-37 TaxID=1677858 RepID=UPI0006BB6A14|nr:glycoside hydrolase family 3 C-terminal domain-containing protein [Propionispora sp. 2/2-37]CUH97046.1 Thermostable beta-glucosidase B [Propionispora sp. 2/2-37]